MKFNNYEYIEEKLGIQRWKPVDDSSFEPTKNIWTDF